MRQRGVGGKNWDEEGRREGGRRAEEEREGGAEDGKNMKKNKAK